MGTRRQAGGQKAGARSGSARSASILAICGQKSDRGRFPQEMEAAAVRARVIGREGGGGGGAAAARRTRAPYPQCHTSDSATHTERSRSTPGVPSFPRSFTGGTLGHKCGISKVSKYLLLNVVDSGRGMPCLPPCSFYDCAFPPLLENKSVKSRRGERSEGGKKGRINCASPNVSSRNQRQRQRKTQ